MESKSALQIDVTFDQILSLVKQLPRKEKIKLSKELEKDAIGSKLTSLLKTFANDELSEETILEEVESVRQANYEKRKR